MDFTSTLPTGTKICLDCNGLTASWFPAERPDDIQSLTLPGMISSGSANMYGTSSFPVGPLNASVKVAAGATVDMLGQFSTAKCICQYDLAGMVRQVGADANGYNSNCRCFGDITLSGNATIKGYNYYLANPTKEFGSVAFNGHTLTLEMENGYVGLGAWRDTAPGGTLAFSGSGSTGSAHERHNDF